MIQKEELLPFLCKLSGKCCVNNEIPLNTMDIFLLAKTLETNPKTLFNQKLISYRIIVSNQWMEPIINTRKVPVCPFLERNSDEYTCSIYETRPLACRLFPMKYDPDSEQFLRNDFSETRCAECISPFEGITLEKYISNADLEPRLEFYKEYRVLIDVLVSKGFNLHDIKNKKDKQKQFFLLQEVLYETYPIQPNDEFFWEKIKTRVLSIAE
ncbi:MAG: YkgJ family cysteine cluster protein [Leptospiraceae bacterium]|nr:YkgJ family cysteine cluster protein [Leptospiraceae bacterium]